MEHIYIHIPFCRNICSYCDFCKIIYNSKYIKQYLDALEREIDDFYQNEVIKTIYIGGGTPSILSEEELNYLFKIIKKIRKAANCEFTFECNPEDITEELITTLQNNNVNRISIGIESFNHLKLDFMKRFSSYEDMKNKIEIIKNKGINNINIDLIYGIPDEDLSILKSDLQLILSLNPTHISTYSLIIEDNTILKINNTEYINEDLEAQMYEYIRKKLKNNHFFQYEVSNFALEGYESKHNLGYWNNHEYYGFGLGAAGYIDGFRYENTKNINKYIKGHYRTNTTILSNQEIMEYELMLGLRKTNGININDFEQKYQVKLEEKFPIKPLIKSKELLIKNGNILINPKKTYTMNEILLKMI